MREGVVKFRCGWTRHGGPGAGSPAAIVVRGHRDGLVVFGPDLDGAGTGVLTLAERLYLSSPAHGSDDGA